MPTFKHPCPHCSKLIERDVVACPYCGTADPFAPARCPNCRTVVEKGWVACPKCGTSLTEPATPSAAPAAAPTAAPAEADPQGPETSAEAMPSQPTAAAPCASCGAPLMAGERFCKTCGALVPEG